MMNVLTLVLVAVISIHHINVTTFSVQISFSKAYSKVFYNESWFCNVIVKARTSRISPREHRFLP